MKNEVYPFFSIIILPGKQIFKLSQCLKSIRSDACGDYELLMPSEARFPERGLFRFVIGKNMRFFSSGEGVNELTECAATVLAGLRAARGRWIIFVNSDEVFIPGALTKYKELLTNGDCDAAVHYCHNTKRIKRDITDLVFRREMADVLEKADLSAEKAEEEYLDPIFRAIVGSGRRVIFSNERLHLQPGVLEDDSMNQLSVHLTDHCNLNCVSCSNFSPAADHTFLDPDEFARDMERAPVTEWLYLMGGEPLLHPEINKIMRIARAARPDARILIITNGTLLKGMPEEFFKTLRELRIGVVHSLYPLKNGRLDLRDLKPRMAYYTRWQVNDFMKMPLDPKGGQDPVLSYAGCTCHFAQMRGGRIYPCPQSAYVSILNKRFGTDFIHEEGDSLALDEIGSIEDLYRWFDVPKPFCRYCAVADYKRIPWEISDVRAEEWLLS